MKMFLTRIGFNSGKRLSPATSLTDRLPRNTKSGLRHAIEVLADVEEISFNSSTAKTWLSPGGGRVSLTLLKPRKKPNKT